MDTIEKTIQISINKSWKGKPKKSITGSGFPILVNQDNERVNLGEGWINVSGSFGDVFRLITEQGYPIAPALLNDSESKSEVNFKSHQILMIDFDNGVTFENVLNGGLYKDFGSGYYTTPSHSQEQPRFRILFLLEQPITNSSDMKKLYRWFLNRYKFADCSCKDSSRYFNGAVNCIDCDITTNYLPSLFIKKALEQQTESEKVELIKLNAKQKNPAKNQLELSEEKKAKILQLLAHSVDKISYNAWLSFCWNFKACGFSLADLINVCNIRFNDSNGCEKVWNTNTTKQGNIGVLINLCKKDHGNDCFESI